MASSRSSAPTGGAGDVSPGGNDSGSTTINAKTRKRTKTGCLTCRKRRIKCGEERPTCGNCIKSKRQCEGYNQRVVFKPPIGDWPNHPGVSNLQYHTSMLPGSRPAYRNPQSTTQPQDAQQAIQTQPLAGYEFRINTSHGSELHHLNAQSGLANSAPSYTHDQNFQQPLQSPHHQQPLQSPPHQLPTPSSATSYFPSQPSPVHAEFPTQYSHNSYEAPQQFPHQGQYQQAPTPYTTSVDQKTMSPQSPDHTSYTRQTALHNPQSHYVTQPYVNPRIESFVPHLDPASHSGQYDVGTQFPAQHSHTGSVPYTQGPYSHMPAMSFSDSTHSRFYPLIPQHDVTYDVKYLPQHAPVLGQSSAASDRQHGMQPSISVNDFIDGDRISQCQALVEAALEDEDDDYYDVQSDEGMLDELEHSDEDAVVLKKDLSLIKQIQSETTNDLSIRGYTAFIYDGILSQHRTEYIANPLRTPKTARVFAHFVHVTGPTLSIYERNPRNPSSLFEAPIPPSQQGLWTYILPLKALDNQGLLHCLLALATLHIAKLQQASVTPSYKHYAYCLERLSRALSSPKRRLQIQTLATSLLLASYEVMAAEHITRSTHLVGAAQLIAELDFQLLTREARRLKATREEQNRLHRTHNPGILNDQQQLVEKPKESATMLDEQLVSSISGCHIDYDDFLSVPEDGNAGERQWDTRRIVPQLDLQSYETYQDLYWYYARQDLYQSLVSGNNLIMDYRKWTDCPPRAAFGCSDAIYGSHDHIVLLMGRIADFIHRDRERKIRQVEAWDGQWRPTPGMPGMEDAGHTAKNKGQGGSFSSSAIHACPRGWNGRQHSGAGSMTGQQPPASQPGQSMRGVPPTAGSEYHGMGQDVPYAPLTSTYTDPDLATIHRSAPAPPDPAQTAPQQPQIPAYPDVSSSYTSALSEWTSISNAQTTLLAILENTPSFAPLPPDLNPPIPGSAADTSPFGPPISHRSYDTSLLFTHLHLARILLLRSHPAMPPTAMAAASVAYEATLSYCRLIGQISASLPLPGSPADPLSPTLGAALIESTMPLFFAGLSFVGCEERTWLMRRLLEIERRTGWKSAGAFAKSCERAWMRDEEMTMGTEYVRGDAETGAGSWSHTVPLNKRNANGRGKDGTLVQPGTACRRQDASSVVRPTVDEIGRGVSKTQPWAMNPLPTDEALSVEMGRVGLGTQR